MNQQEDSRKVFEELMNERYIVKNIDREKYFFVKDKLPTIKEFCNDKLGYRIIQNQTLIKLEKLPGEAEGFMGIQEFESVLEYQLFCIVLMFLEDKESKEQFVLSSLTEYVQAQFPKETIMKRQDENKDPEENRMVHNPFFVREAESVSGLPGGIDWTIYEHRRKLVRVLKFCIKQKLIILNDGSEEGFSQDLSTEVLYENTGVSRYFVKNFMKDISGYENVSDFYQSDWNGMDEDRGIIRRQRVYRKLLLSPGMYKKEDMDEDFNYLKNYRNVIENDLEKYVDCSLQVHKSSAYMILGEDGGVGKIFPMQNSVSDAMLLFFSRLREKVEAKELLLHEINETITMSKMDLIDLLKQCKQDYGKGFAKKYREEMSENEFAKVIFEELEQLGFIEWDEITDQITVFPIAGKICGGYPADFQANE